MVKTIKFFVGILFMIFAYFNIDTGNITEGSIMQLIDLIALIFGLQLSSSALGAGLENYAAKWFNR